MRSPASITPTCFTRRRGCAHNANQLAKVANTYGEASQQDIEMTKLARQVWEEVKNNW